MNNPINLLEIKKIKAVNYELQIIIFTLKCAAASRKLGPANPLPGHCPCTPNPQHIGSLLLTIKLSTLLILIYS